MSLCLCEELTQIKVEADLGADPLWCNHCSVNIEIVEFSLPRPLKEDLFAWVRGYGTWIDWETDAIVPNGVKLEQQHNERGRALTEKVKQALLEQYEVVFSPSVFAKRHANA